VSLLTLMGEAAGAMLLVDRLMENPRMRKGSKGKGRKRVTRAPVRTKRMVHRAAPKRRAVAKSRRKPVSRSVVKTVTRTTVRSNPVRHGYDVSAAGAQLATFKTRKHATQYAQAFADTYGVTVQVERI